MTSNLKITDCERKKEIKDNRYLFTLYLQNELNSKNLISYIILTVIIDKSTNVLIIKYIKNFRY